MSLATSTATSASKRRPATAAMAIASRAAGLRRHARQTWRPAAAPANSGTGGARLTAIGEQGVATGQRDDRPVGGSSATSAGSAMRAMDDIGNRREPTLA